MMRIITIIALALIIPITLSHAQQDSLIIEGLTVEQGSATVNARIWAVVYDSIFDYDMTLSWDAPQGGVSLSAPFFYYPPLTLWDNNSSFINNDLHTVNLAGISNLDSIPNPPLFTSGIRVNIITLRFHITPGTPAQDVTIDTLGPLDFGPNPLFVGGQMHIIIIPAVGEDVTAPRTFELNQNYPNPFNASTTIEFSLERNEDVTLVIYDLLGRRTRHFKDGLLDKGSSSVVWDGKNESGYDVPSGTYFYKLTAGDEVQTKRMILVR